MQQEPQTLVKITQLDHNGVIVKNEGLQIRFLIDILIDILEENINIKKKNETKILQQVINQLMPHINTKASPVYTNGIDEQWIKSNNFSIEVSDEEWRIAESIMNQMIGQDQTLPFKISRKDWEMQYPELKHSFVVINTPQGPKCGCLARSKSEGIIAHGKNGVLKVVQWQDGSQDAIKIEPQGKVDNAHLLKNIDYVIDAFIRVRPEQTPWIKNRDKVKTIQNKKYTLQKKIDGETLGNFLKDKQAQDFTYDEKIEIALQCAESIQSLHAKKLIHGDIHPGNLMINQQHQITAIDLNTLHQLQLNEQKIHLGKPIGSRSYMAPEVGVWQATDKQGNGIWLKKEGDISLESDVYSLARMYEKNFKLAGDPAFGKLIAKMKSEDPAQRPSVVEVIAQIKQIQSNNQLAHFHGYVKNPIPLTISVGQSLLVAYDYYKVRDPIKAEKIKKLYTLGFRSTEDNQFFDELKQTPCLKGYQISDDYKIIADDASRRYFETHLSFETMKDALKDYPLELLQNHFNSIKSCFEELGGDLDFQKFKKTKDRVLRRNYKKEVQNRIKENKDPNELIKGISSEEQQQIDRLFSGQLDKNDDGINIEYADMITRIKNSQYLSEQDKEKALLIVKSTRLSMILGNKMEKYKNKGTYSGKLMPGEYIYKSGIYQPENRGRILKGQSDVRSHNMGLLLADMPLSKQDEAYSESEFCYQKPSENGTYAESGEWIEYSMGQKVHTFSNGISGTLLAQLRMMIKLHQEGKLTFKTKEELQNYFKSMISIMTYISGGHSLLEFTGPLELEQVRQEFKFIPGFNDISLESMFHDQNGPALEKALDKTLQYNEQYMQLTQEKMKEALYDIPTISEEAVLTQFKLLKTDPYKYNPIRIKVKPEDYSFMNANNVYQNPGLIVLMNGALGGKIDQVVTFRPERALLHEVAAYVSAFIQTDNEKSRNDLIQTVAKELSDKANQIDQVFLSTRQKVAKEIASILNGKGEGSKDLLEAIETAKKMKLPQAYCPEIDSVEKLAVEIVTAQRGRKSIEKQISKMVSGYFNNNHVFQKKSSAENNRPVVMFASGGQGTGKGTIVSSMLNEASTHGLDPKDFVYLNNDSYKALLQDPSMDSTLFSQLTHTEARIIRDRAFKMAKDKNMHLLLDQVSMSESATHYALNKNGVVKGVVVSTNVEDALDRCFERGQSMGRFEDTQSVLKCHHDAPMQAQAYIVKNQGQNLHLDFFDNNVAQGEAPTLFMEVNCKSHEVVVHDDVLLKEYIKKQLINLSATKFIEIYPLDKIKDGEIDSLVNSWMDNLKNAGYEIKTQPTRKLARLRAG